MLFRPILLIISTAVGTFAAVAPRAHWQITYSDDEPNEVMANAYFEQDQQDDIQPESPVYKYVSDFQGEQTYQEPPEEKHKVTLISNCNSGKAVYTDNDHPQPRGNGTYPGLVSGIAYLQEFEHAHCQYGGVNCGAVQFTLSDGSGHGMMNSASYDLMDAPGFGNHKFHYKMNYKFEGETYDCDRGSAAEGPCTGGTPEQCPGGFFGGDWYSGRRTECRGSDVGIIITFC
ncbi:uncharacterized protein I206_103575 [Kwoniella pini CBS 10737]|uniref:Uncharacterized protein n=1 Tax=Kwoniella pini CBS 10737 TaxID=1296096 RepID=A0A1B9I9C7_9TREE|nr:uncharacterized protein I206_01420 [Kwoniella pini CBS 10737]OCF52135.1 hypothetical protein I206_01420 [Kwoniella pini CBS 10737]